MSTETISKKDQLRAGLKKILGGDDHFVNREQDTTLRDEKGKLKRDALSAHTIGLMESRLKDCTKLEVGVSAFGKKAVVEVDPRNMASLSMIDRACAVAALNPDLAAKDEVSSVNAHYSREACGAIIADHIGAVTGNDDIGNALIVAAAVSGTYGKKLYAKILGDEPESKAKAGKKAKPEQAVSDPQVA